MYTMVSERWFIALSSVTLLFLAASADAQQDMSEWPEWLRSAMLEEAKPKRARKVAFADAASVKLPGKPQEAQAFESGWYFASEIGAGGTIECYVLTNEPDLATLVIELGEINIDFMSEQYGEVANKGLYDLDAGAIEGKPYLALDWMYTVGEAPEAKAALTKVRVAANDTTIQACVHNGLGYRETLERVFRTFVTSLDYPTTATPAYYREVVKMSFGEQPVGVMWMSYTLDADGDTEIRTGDAQLMPVDTGAVRSSDTVSVSYSSPDGQLINKSSATVENGELVTHVDLLPDAEGDWVVSGTFQGKGLTARLDGETVPISELGQQFRAQELLAGDNDEVTMPLWVPEADPTSFLMATIERVDGAGRNNARLAMGPIDLEVEIDETGSMKRGSMQAGAATVHMERIHVEGKAR